MPKSEWRRRLEEAIEDERPYGDYPTESVRDRIKAYASSMLRESR